MGGKWLVTTKVWHAVGNTGAAQWGVGSHRRPNWLCWLRGGASKNWMPKHSKKNINKKIGNLKCCVELRVVGELHTSKKPGQSANFDFLKVSKMTIIFCNLFKMSKMSIKFFDLLKSTKRLLLFFICSK